MNEKLAGKVAIVTGGSSGIGRALAEELASRGCEVVIADRQLSLAREVATRIHNFGGKAEAVELDVRDLDAFTRLAKDTVARLRRIDFLFNNAGIAVGGEMDEYTAADYDDVFDVNLRGVAYGIQAIYPIMVEQRSGHIINTASVAGLIASGGAGSYTATKHAVVGLSKGLRIEAHRHGVNVSVVCPGAIRTPILTGGHFGRMNMKATAKTIMKQWERVRPMDPAVFAKKCIDRVLKNDPIIVLPSWWKAMWLVDRISPRLGLYLGRRMFENVRAEIEKERSKVDAHTEEKTNGSSAANGNGSKEREARAS